MIWFQFLFIYFLTGVVSSKDFSIFHVQVLYIIYIIFLKLQSVVIRNTFLLILSIYKLPKIRNNNYLLICELNTVELVLCYLDVVI